MGTVIELPSRVSDVDRRLQERFRAGDPDAFDALVAPCLDPLYTFCLRVTGSSESGFDLAHDTLVRARRKHARFEPGRPLRPWLMTIAKNLWLSQLRSPWVRVRDTVRALADTLRSPTDGPDRAAERLDSDAKIRRALAELSPPYREALALFHLEDMSYAEMSEITGVTVAALKQRVRRGSALLADRISEMYPELAPARRDRGGDGCH